MSIRFIPAALIAIFIGLVAVGGAAMAIGFGDSDKQKTDDLLERAATELGVESQALKDALAQARADLMSERQQEVLAELVEEEVITQQQADEAAAWLNSRPAVVDRLAQPGSMPAIASSSLKAMPIDVFEFADMPYFGSLLGDEVTERMAQILGVEVDALEGALENAHEGQLKAMQAEAINKMIDQLVEDGEITQAEGDQVKAWLDNMPAWLNDHDLLFELLSTGVAHSFPAFELHGFHEGPFGEFAHPDEFEFESMPFFFGPGGGGFRFEAPEGEFPDRHFFFDGPEGQFRFDGEVPPELDELFERFGGRFGFGDDFDFDELFERFERARPFELEPPAGDDDSEDDNPDQNA